MSRSFVVAVILLMGVLFPITMMDDTAKASTLYVGGAGPWNYTTIQGAIDDTDSGDTVYVFSGIYYEHLVINKTLTLIGENRESTVINGSATGTVILVLYTGANVSGLSVVGSGSEIGDAGIELFRSRNSHVIDNNIQDNRYGIYIQESDDNTILNNTISNNSYGLRMESSENNTMADNYASFNAFDGISLKESFENALVDNSVFHNRLDGIHLSLSSNNTILANNISWNKGGIDFYSSGNNTIRDNSFHHNEISSIYISYSQNNTLQGNLMVENGIHREGDELEHWNTHSIDTSNTVGGGPVYYWKDVVGGKIPTDAGQVVLANCTNVIVEDQDMGNVYSGIHLGFSTKTSVRNNTVSNGWYGVRLYSSSDNSISGNAVSGNEMFGIHLEYSVNNAILDNDVRDNMWGIVLEHSEENTVEANQVLDQGQGVRLWLSDSNIIRDNFMNDNHYGVYIEFSDSNTIVGNRLQKSADDIYIRSSQGAMLHGNYMTGGGIYIDSRVIEGWNTHTIDTSNRVQDKDVYYWKNVSGGRIPENAGQVILANCTNVVVEDQDIRQTAVGVAIGFSTKISVMDNYFASNSDGIYLQGSNDNSIRRNEIQDPGRGILLRFSEDNKIEDNEIGNGWTGIHLHISDRNKIEQNTLFNLNFSIRLEWSNANLIEGNWLFENDVAIYLESDCTENLIRMNDVVQNWVGISLVYSSDNEIVLNVISHNRASGIRLYSSNSNRIYHNNIFENEQQAFDDGSNEWDDGYPSGGNYWGDYTGADEKKGSDQDEGGGDGIGDIPDHIEGGTSIDQFPLMQQYSEEDEAHVEIFWILIAELASAVVILISALVWIKRSRREPSSEKPEEEL